jgi:hypothetical protein
MVDCHKVTPLALHKDLDGHDGLYLPFHKDLILEQFTGLLDRFSKEIYEGDILKEGESNWLCRWYCQSFWVERINAQGAMNHWSTFAVHAEVIGNIHENKELLK